MDKPHLIRIDDTIFNPGEITQVEIAHTEMGHHQLVTLYFTDGKSKAFRDKAAAAALAALGSMTTEIKTE
jgi:hypothetical protein